MRIGILFEFPDPQIGGAYSFVTNLVRDIEANLHEFPHEFVFLNSNPHSKFYSKCGEYLNLPEFKIPLKSRLLLKVFRKFGLRLNYEYQDSARHPWDRLFKEHQIDFVWSLMPVRKPFSTPFATTIWDLDHLVNPFFPEFSLGREWESRERDMEYAIKTAALVVTGTSVTGDLVIKNYALSEDRIVISPFVLHSRDHSVGQRDTNLIFYPAQFWAHKNHVNLLRALKILVDAGMDQLRLLLSGSDKGNLEFIRREVAKLSLENHVEFLGFLDDLEIASLYQSVGIVAFPSFCGPDNLPPLEALSYSAPAAISDLPGLRTLWGNAFYYFDPNSPRGISEAILEGLRNGVSEEMQVQRELLEEILSPLRSIETVVRRIESLAPRLSNFS